MSDVPAEARRRHDVVDVDGDVVISVNRPADAPRLTPGQEDAFRALAAAALEHVDRERVEKAGFPYPIRRCPPRELGQR